MSRVGKRPVVLPDKVKAEVANGTIKVTGPQGCLEFKVAPMVNVGFEDKAVVVTRKDDSRDARMQHGMVRAIVANMVHGVSEGFSKSLDIVGIGYKAEAKDQEIVLTMGFSHPVNFAVPVGIKVNVEKQVRIVVSGADKQLVGETAARIRKIRPPEPYKGKGIRYVGEHVRRKVGKAAASTGGA